MEIRIDGTLIDSGSAVIAVAKQGFDFSDLKKRFLGRSNRFSLPRTSLNRSVFNAPDIINTGANSFERIYNVSIEDQGVVILKGVGILQESSTDYKLQVIDSAKLLFDALNAALSELDLDSEDFIFGTTAYTQLNLYAGNDTIWIWPFDTQFINNDYTKTLFTGDLHYSRPHFRADKIIEKALAEKGWSIDGLSSLGVDFSAISSNHSAFYATGYEALLNFSVTTGSMLDTIADSIFIAPSFAADGGGVVMPNNKTAYRLKGSISSTSDFEIKITSTSQPLGTNVVTSYFFVNAIDTEIDFTTDEFETEEATNRVTFEVAGTGSLTFINTQLYSITEENSFGDLSGGTFGVGVLDGYKIKTVENIPDITQLSLFRELWTLFAFNFNINQTTKEINAYSIADIDRSNAVDWSSKFIIDSEIVSLSKTSLGKNTFLTYSNDDTVNSGTGDTFFTVDNDTLPDSEVYVNSLFSASETVDFLGSPTVPVPVAVMRIYNETERENTIDIRIKIIKERPSQSWSTEATFAPLDWSILKDSKYNTIIEALQKGRYVKAKFNLTKLDIIGVDFSKPIYIEYFKSYFILANTGNYVAGRLTTCELLKIN